MKTTQRSYWIALWTFAWFWAVQHEKTAYAQDTCEPATVVAADVAEPDQF